jgi:outer membrane protein OmpA-like peptidoglycan-associated protein/Tol biopolymer transport system component
MKYLFMIIFILFSLCLNAQYDPARANKKAVQAYTKAMELAENGDYKQSIKVLQEAVKIDPKYADAWLSIAGMHGEMKNYDEAISSYQKAKAIDSDYFKDYNLPYSINFAGKGEFEEALTAVNGFLSITNLNETSRKAGEYRKRCYTFAVEYAKTHHNADYKFEPRNLGDSVNTKELEYFPTLTIDGKELIFTRRINNNNEDFYGSDLVNDKWGKAKSLSGNINTNRNEAAQNISQDGQWLIFTGGNFPEGYGNFDLYISYLTPSGEWSTPENLGPNINTASWESSPSLSPDKRDLYFASGRAGGYGGSDIYVSHYLPNGKWGPAENLGPEINTPGDESCPFIHADNQTLYFTSNGHPGYGGDDLYIAHKGPKGKWSIAEDLGYPINTIEKEGTMIVTADGKTAYFASERKDTRGGLDIYTFELRNDVRPVKTLWVKGKVFDKKTDKGLPSAVELTDLLTKEVVSKVQTDETGNYLITLPTGRDYAFNVNRRGYLFFSENFSLREKSPDSTYNIGIPLQPIEANALIVLKNIFFDVNKFELKTSSQVELGSVVQLLKENPTLKIQINGHTDNVGNAAANLKLSNDRARAVVNYLSANGIDPKRLSYKGFGDIQPTADNKNEEGRAQNRRTELKVVSK